MKPYLQTTSFTTAASALLTILHHYVPSVALSKENEFQIWRNTVNLPTRASSIYALAHYAQKNGLKAKVRVENKEYDFPDYRFYRYTKEDVENAFFFSNLHYLSAKRNGVEIEEKEIKFQDIKAELRSNNLLLRVNTKPIRKETRNTSNYVVVYDYKDGVYFVIDPKLGNVEIKEEVMQEAFQTLETKKYRDHRMILFKKTKN